MKGQASSAAAAAPSMGVTGTAPNQASLCTEVENVSLKIAFDKGLVFSPETTARNSAKTNN